MTRGFSNQLLSQLSEFVAGHIGLHFPPERWRDLERGIRSVARVLGVADAECAQWLLSAPLTKHEIEILAGELTVGETYFFREKRSFEILGERILPELIRVRQGGDRRLRIWSAGCCTGEEPYSIAILLDRVLPEPREWHVTMLATDINPRFLQKASVGVFAEWSFRDAPPWLKENYFKPFDGHRFEILPRIKEKVTFAYLNLAEDAYPSLSNNTNAMDVIFCRNVLMYFAPERARKAIHNFHRSLLDGGWLIVSPTETSAQLFSPFAAIQFNGAILYRKGDAQDLRSSRREEALTRCEVRGPKVEVEVSLLTSAATYQEPRVLPPSPEPSVHDEFGLRGQAERDPALASPAIADDRAKAPSPLRSAGALHDRAAPTPYQDALALFERGDYAQAAQKLKANFAHSENASETSALLARTCANLGELAEARAWAEKAIAADKLNAGLHYLRAVILQEQGAGDEAAATLRRALYLDPDFVLAHFALGNLALRQRRFAEADKHFTNALAPLERYGPNDVLPHSDGLAAGRLREMIQSTLSVEAPA